MFLYSLSARSLDLFLNWPLGTFHSWYNIKAAFKERFGLPSTISFNRELIFAFKQRDDEKFTHAWERFRGFTYEMDHGLRDWMIIHVFYSGLIMSSKSYLNKQSGKTFLELTTDDAYKLLDNLLLECKIKSSLEKIWGFQRTF
jgi:hypothetical protein